MDDVAKDFLIPADNLPRLREAFARIEKRARKLRVEAPTIMVGAEVTKVEQRPTGETVFRDGHYVAEISTVVHVFYPVTVTGRAPHFPGGWQLAARIDHVEGGNVLATVPGIPELPAAYRTDAPTCDHCKLSRRRNETFVCLSEAGVYTRVGRQCLANFLGASAEDPERVCMLFQIVADACEAAEDASEGGGSAERTLDPLATLATAVAVVRERGWMSGSEAWDRRLPSTKSLVLEQLDPDWCKKHPGDVILVTEADYAQAEAARDWAQNHTDESDFAHNLRTVAHMEFLRRKYAGIAVYIPVGYARFLGDEVKRKRAAVWANCGPSQHFGTVKVRADYRLTVEHIGELKETEWGVSQLVVFRDASGNVAKWFSSHDVETWLTVGEAYNLAVTVKAHDQYKGEKQTMLTRVDLAKEKPVKKPRAKKAA